MAKSDNLRKAKSEKNDEFYTQLDDIVAEIAQHKDYVRQFQGKTVLCNCDDPEWSSFVEFFRKFFKKLGLKKMISTHYNKDGSPSYKLEWSGEKINGDTVNMIKTSLKGNGDFRSDECIELLKEADIVVTNPPFSLFREYVAQLIEHRKQFVILGSMNSITYKDFFSYLKNGFVQSGYGFNKTMEFIMPDEYELKGKAYIDKKGKKHGFVPAMCWFTNLDLDKAHEPIMLTKNYIGNEDRYPRYYNYDGIDVSSINLIPKDYYGHIGVPITFLGECSLEQFDIIGLGTYVPKNKQHVSYKKQGIIQYEDSGKVLWVTKYTVSERKIGNSLRLEENGMPGKSPYGRIIIQRKGALRED